jgi:ribosomal protein S25
MVRKNKPISKRRSTRAPKEEERSRSYEAVRRDLIITEEQKQTMEKEIPGMKLITPSSVAQKYNIRVSIAKAILAELEAKGLIQKIETQGKFKLFTKASS